MGSNRSLSEDKRVELRETFERTVDVILQGIGPKAFRLAGDRVNAALLDSLMVGVALRLGSGPIADLIALRRAYEQLTSAPEYQAAIG